MLYIASINLKSSMLLLYMVLLMFWRRVKCSITEIFDENSPGVLSQKDPHIIEHCCRFGFMLPLSTVSIIPYKSCHRCNAIG
jgi:hypothetical protein